MQRSKDILELLRSVIEAHRMTVLMITHDQSIVCRMADRIAIMNAGYLMETADRESFFSDCRHPYSREFLRVVTDEDLYYIPGSVPDLLLLPKGCPFAPRCSRKQPLCEEQMPPMKGSETMKGRSEWIRYTIPLKSAGTPTPISTTRPTTRTRTSIFGRR